MRAKPDERAQADALRRQGLSYSEIAARIPVAQGSLSLWLRDIPLDDAARERLRQRQLIGQRMGAAGRHTKALAADRRLHEEAAIEVGRLSARDLFIAGVVAYWCEGAKSKPS